MKKLLLLLGITISVFFQSSAIKNRVIVENVRISHAGKSTTVRRSPMRLPIEVFFNDETNQLEITGDENAIVQIRLLDDVGNVIGCSSSINCTFDIPYDYTGLLIIQVDGINWTALGDIII